MSDVLFGLLGFVIFAVIAWGAWKVLKFFGALLMAMLTAPSDHNRPSRGEGTHADGMNEGDFHSGPDGYSPNTAYPETQYGSGFDEDEEWNR
jgi:hypothetical protein